MFAIAKKNYRESKQEYLPNLLKQNSKLSSLYYDRKAPKYKIVAVFFVNDACTAVDQNGLLHRILKHVGVPLCLCKVLFCALSLGSFIVVVVFLGEQLTKSSNTAGNSLSEQIIFYLLLQRYYIM